MTSGRPAKGAVVVENGRFYTRFQIAGKRQKNLTDATTRAEANIILLQRMAEAATDSSIRQKIQNKARIGEAICQWKIEAKRSSQDSSSAMGFAKWLGPATPVHEVDSGAVSSAAEEVEAAS